MATRITEGGGRGVSGKGGGGGTPRTYVTGKGGPKIKVSSSVSVKPKGKMTEAELARLKNINKPTKKTTPKEKKVNAKALKASGVAKPKTDTMYTRSTNKASDPFAKTKISARDLTKEAVAKRASRAY